MLRRARRIVLASLAVVVVGAAGAAFWVRGQVQASLPLLDGDRTLPGLAAPVRVERDSRGVPVIRGEGRIDVARATGFVHAQERFFQMDLLRRKAAGELADLVGPAALDVDREIRVHRLRHRAGRVTAAAEPTERRIVEAYTEGVNAGLAALGAPPFEYLVLRAEPAPWRPEDTTLVAFAMFIELQEEKGERESAFGVLADVLPPDLVAFLAPGGTEWDAPLVGSPVAQPPPPPAEVFDLRREPPLEGEPRSTALEEAAGALGSNNWAVAGSRTEHGGALLANDMHLGIAVPNTWYRVSLVWKEGGAQRRMTGVTLPGTPAVVVGSNGHVAWGFTNTCGDWSDLVVLEPAGPDPDAYLTPEGPRKLTTVRERLRVKGAPDETLEVLETVWGPVVDRDHRGRRRALSWVAHHAEGVDLRLLDVERARGVDEALTLAAAAGAPAQNFVCADAAGRIGWTVLGRIPRRVGFDGRRPASWADGTRRWEGWLDPGEHPRVVDPTDGLVWTANARVLDAAHPLIGDGELDLGARARQIRDDLRALETASERDMLGVQLDDRALFLARWRALLMSVLTPDACARDPRRAEMRRLVEGWGGRASVDSAGYRIVRLFRSLLAEEVLGALTARVKAADARFEARLIPQWEGPLWALVTERPPHLLQARYGTWDEQLLAAADATLKRLAAQGSPLSARTWGEHNRVAVQHPLSRAVPLLSRWLDMPLHVLPGDSHMPRVQTARFGASERLVVSPGRESEGYFHMPAGQSGHPLSRHYGDGHAAWVRGEPTPFLPGPPVHVLNLEPE